MGFEETKVQNRFDIQLLFVILPHEKTNPANRFPFDGPCGALSLNRLGREVPLLHRKPSLGEQLR